MRGKATATVVAGIALIAAIAPSGAAAHGGYGDAYGNCLAYLSSSWVESYTPAGLRVLNTTRRRDRQTISYRASLIYYGHNHYENHAYEWADPFQFWRWDYGESFYTVVKEKRGRRWTSPYWARASNGDVRAWGTRWIVPLEVSSQIEIELIWRQGARVVDSHTYRLQSLNYPVLPSNSRTWGTYCYRWNNGLTTYHHPVRWETIYFPSGRSVPGEAGNARVAQRTTTTVPSAAKR